VLAKNALWQCTTGIMAGRINGIRLLG
jgi:hypothetical protein